MAKFPEYIHFRIKSYGTEISVEDANDIEFAPVRHGRWVSVPHKKERICSRCEQDEPYKFADEDANVFDYCPHCGAKMDGE